MPITADILSRRLNSFVLWCPSAQSRDPELLIARLVPGNPPTLADVAHHPLAAGTDPDTGAALEGLYSRSAADCELADGVSYHYWFVVDDSRSGAPGARAAVTDPFATCVDWRVFPHDADGTFPAGGANFEQPAAVVRHTGGGALAETDPGGEAAEAPDVEGPDGLLPNNRLVVYELPTAWTGPIRPDDSGRAAATFADVTALIDPDAVGANFADLQVLQQGRTHLGNLGVNALELLPPADSYYRREWGYGTSHYLAPDYELGFPEGNISPTANRDLARLVQACHASGIRFFADVVMAFGKNEPYGVIDRPDFCIDDPGNHRDDVDAWTSGRGDAGMREIRNGFGAALWRYSRPLTTYDPVSGRVREIFPARQLMMVALARWMRDFGVDGLRLDSVENVANWDFVRDYKDAAWGHYRTRRGDAGLAEADDRFLVVGEELSLPRGLLAENRLDGLWNEGFQTRVRAMILGDGSEDDYRRIVPDAIDCRRTGKFDNGTQAINYVTKHDVEGPRHERLFTMLRSVQNANPAAMTDEGIKKRIELAFVCLLTSVGIPMMLAGEEFADQHDLFDAKGNVTQSGGKQIDPVNFGRLHAEPTNKSKDEDPDGWYGPMRREIFAYVSRLVKLRTATPALWDDEVDFFWTDFGEGKRVFAWRRGPEDDPVVVLANFSDYGSPSGSDYVVRGWPRPAPDGRSWFDASQDGAEGSPGRRVPEEWIAREPIFPWEAKVYRLAAG